MASSGNARHFALVGPMHPYRGGIAHMTEETRRGLEQRSHRVSALTFRRQYPSLLFPGKTQYEQGPPPHEPPAHRLIDTVNPLTWWQAARWLRQRGPETVVFQHWMPFIAPAYGAMARRVDARVLAVVHNALPHERRPGDKLLNRYFFRACDGFVVLSDAVGRDLRKLGVEAPIQRINHPTYTHFGAPAPRGAARQRLDLPPDAPVLLFFGFVRAYKGLHVLLDALPQICAQLPDVHLVIAGEFYDDEAPYHAQIEQSGLKARVHLHAQYIPTEEVADYFSAADLVVQPYVSATQSGVAQIAFHFETPLVVTDVGGLAQVVPHDEAGLVVPPEDPAALAAATVRFFSEDGLQMRLREGVRTRRETYSWDRLYEALENLAGR